MALKWAMQFFDHGQAMDNTHFAIAQGVLHELDHFGKNSGRDFHNIFATEVLRSTHFRAGTPPDVPRQKTSTHLGTFGLLE